MILRKLVILAHHPELSKRGGNRSSQACDQQGGMGFSTEEQMGRLSYTCNLIYAPGSVILCGANQEMILPKAIQGILHCCACQDTV